MKCLLEWVSKEDVREVEISTMEELCALSRAEKHELIFNPWGFDPRTAKFGTPVITVYDDYLE